MKASCWFRVAIVKVVGEVGGEGRKSQRRGQTTKYSGEVSLAWGGYAGR